MTFYFFFWRLDINDAGKYPWEFSISAVCYLRHVYPDSKIVFVCYENPSDKMLSLREDMNIEFEVIENYYIISNVREFENLNNGARHFLSKPMDAYLLSKRRGDKYVVVLDVDFFVLDKFVDLPENKFGVLFWGEECCNTGMLAFNPFSKETEICMALYRSMLHGVNYIHPMRKKTEFLAYRREDSTFQEEMIFKLLFLKYNEIIHDIFQDIGFVNHQIYHKDYLLDYKRPIHLGPSASRVKKERIFRCMMRTNYFKHIMINCKSSLVKEIFDICKNDEMSDEEKKIVESINNSFPEYNAIREKTIVEFANTGLLESDKVSSKRIL